jgi:hypothetical protein
VPCACLPAALSRSTSTSLALRCTQDAVACAGDSAGLADCPGGLPLPLAPFATSSPHLRHTQRPQHSHTHSNELVLYEALGLCPRGGGGPLVDSAVWTGELCRVGGAAGWVVNPSGGLESKGHPLGATGIAMVAEVCLQLRGTAGARQVRTAGGALPRVGLCHNYGWASAAVVTLLEMPGAETWAAAAATTTPNAKL